MKAPKEIKDWINQHRKSGGKPNGVIPWLFDAPTVERKLQTNKRLNNRHFDISLELS